MRKAIRLNPDSGARCLIDCSIKRKCLYSARKNYIRPSSQGAILRGIPSPTLTINWNFIARGKRYPGKGLFRHRGTSKHLMG